MSAMLGRAGADDHGGPERSAGNEFEPGLDLIAPVIGATGLLAAAQFSGGPVLLAAARLLVGAAFLGCVTDAMLLGHWYLVQPGLPRDAVKQLVRLTAVIWPVEVAVMLWPTGMVQVLERHRRRRLEGHARMDVARVRGRDDRAWSASRGPRCASAPTRR